MAVLPACWYVAVLAWTLSSTQLGSHRAFGRTHARSRVILCGTPLGNSDGAGVTAPASTSLGSGAVDCSGDGGVVKMVLQQGQVEPPNPFGLIAGTPPMGARVRVHYVGRLAATGEQFDSSRDRGAPFEFVLGAGTVIRGWETAVGTMVRDELALVRCRPEYAYGARGVRPSIPSNTTLDFEIELLGWEDFEGGAEYAQQPDPFDDLDDEDEEGEVTVDLSDFDEWAGRTDEPVDFETRRGRARAPSGTQYDWEETEATVTLSVPIPDSVGSRDVECTVTTSTFSLVVEAAGVSIVGLLRGRVRGADAYWLIDLDSAGRRSVQVFMDKRQAFPMWDGVVDGHEFEASTGGIDDGDVE